MHQHHGINYLEIPCRELDASKAFFSQVFGWTFTDYGPDYSCFLGTGIDGGFYRSPLDFECDRGSPLIVLYSADLNASLNAVRDAGGRIVKPVFAFPGGRRFHFADPSGNEYAAWSE
ncbi:VOC family protein [Pseudomonas sp. BMS12]|uniref:VOC family protein n=1 Tax=Pseudomonas sp. BMS12 TaxID=1796033 RepID=UPI00083A7644|nr:VOC family protein [Pseudomonas sp. BMS12]